jgi:hypothetical protein
MAGKSVLGIQCLVMCKSLKEAYHVHSTAHAPLYFSPEMTARTTDIGHLQCADSLHNNALQDALTA